MLQYLPAVKAIGQIVAGMGVSKIVTDIVQNNVALSTPAQAVTVKVGTFVLGSMLWEQSSNHIDRQVTNLLELVRKDTDDSTTE